MSESNPQIATVELAFVVAVEKVREAPFARYASSISSFVKSGTYSTASTLVLMLFNVCFKTRYQPKENQSTLPDDLHQPTVSCLAPLSTHPLPRSSGTIGGPPLKDRSVMFNPSNYESLSKRGVTLGASLLVELLSVDPSSKAPSTPSDASAR
jgi:hypothetical protein